MNFLKLLSSANNIWLATHISPDGDGLGSEVALYHALKSKNNSVRIVQTDSIPDRYQFLFDGIETLQASQATGLFSGTDVALIFDTHDPKLCAPIFSDLQKSKTPVIFIDHHVSSKENLENVYYHINENACCTGEIVLDLMKELRIPLDKKSASALYTSLLFDTQSFQFIRDSAKPFEIAKELIAAGAEHSRIHQNLFENWSVAKMNYLAKLISLVIYPQNEVAIIPISRSDLKEHNLSNDDVSDLVDLFMSLKDIQISIVVREENPRFHKLSYRSRSYEILQWAREFGGGGHLFSAGALVHDTRENIMKKIIDQIESRHGKFQVS